MMNKNVINVAKFSFVSSLKSKVFVIFNVIMFLAIAAFFNFNTVKEILNKNDIHIGTSYNIEVEDSEGEYYNNILSIKDMYNISNIDRVDKLPDYTLDTIEKDTIALKSEYNEDNFNITIISKEKIDGNLYDKLTSIANDIKNQKIEAKYSISSKDSDLYNNYININRVVLDEESVVEENYTYLTFAMTMIIYFLVIFGTNAVASQIANEKTSKSAEYIFSSIPAKDYLNGKVIGANLKTLISMLLMIFYVVISLTLNSLIVNIFNVNSVDLSATSEIATGIDVNALGAINFDTKVIAYIGINFVFILLTSILLSYIQAGITAKVKSISDMDSSQSITLIIIVIAYFLAFAITGINNIFTKILANIPIFSMFLMPVNYLNDVANIYMVILSIIIVVISIILVMYFVSKTFKKNILDISSRSAKTSLTEELDETEKQFSIINKKSLSSLSVIISIALVSLILVQAILGVILALISPHVTANIYNVLMSLIFTVSMVVPIFIIKIFLPDASKNYRDASNGNKSSKGFDIKLFFIGFAVIVAVQALGEFIISKFGISSDLITNMAVYDKSIVGVILFTIQLAALPGILEELLFRKYILNSCRRYGSIFAIIVSSVSFALIHLNLSQGIVALLIGVLFSYITLKQSSVKTNIALHITNNLFATLEYVFENNEQALSVINYVYIGLAILGGIIFVVMLIKNRNYFKINLNSPKEKYNKANLKDFVFNYYFIILIIFILISMIVTY